MAYHLAAAAANDYDLPGVEMCCRHQLCRGLRRLLPDLRQQLR